MRDKEHIRNRGLDYFTAGEVTGELFLSFPILTPRSLETLKPISPAGKFIADTGKSIAEGISKAATVAWAGIMPMSLPENSIPTPQTEVVADTPGRRKRRRKKYEGDIEHDDIIGLDFVYQGNYQDDESNLFQLHLDDEMAENIDSEVEEGVLIAYNGDVSDLINPWGGLGMDKNKDKQTSEVKKQNNNKKSREKHSRKKLLHPEVNENLGLSGKGYKNNSSQKHPENEKWAQPEVVEAFESIAADWIDDNPNNPIYVNDLSREGGGPIPPHKGKAHQNGTAIDIKYMTKDGSLQPGDYNKKGSKYDYNKTKELVEEFLNYDDRSWFEKLFGIGKPSVKVSKIYFNDKKIIDINDILIEYHPGHSNHLHIEFEINK